MKKIHLTFDDGPHATNTTLVLNILKSYKINATFFVLGEKIKNNGGIIERMASEGHRIGNHTYSHRKLTTLSEKEIINEIKTTETAILNHAPVDYILRPPYGARDKRVSDIIKSLGYNIVMWNVDTEDWKRKPDEWLDYGLEQINRQDKSLVLMHDIHPTTASNLQRFIDKIKIIGAEFVSLEYITGFPSPENDSNTSTEAPAGTVPVRYHTVVTGDTLSSISQKYYGTPNRWKIIYEVNSSLISNPNIISPGIRLMIP